MLNPLSEDHLPGVIEELLWAVFDESALGHVELISLQEMTWHDRWFVRSMFTIFRLTEALSTFGGPRQTKGATEHRTAAVFEAGVRLSKRRVRRDHLFSKPLYDVIAGVVIMRSIMKNGVPRPIGWQLQGRLRLNDIKVTATEVFRDKHHPEVTIQYRVPLLTTTLTYRFRSSLSASGKQLLDEYGHPITTTMD